MRLVTRSDFDGLACAVLLKHIKLIDSYKFVHPKDVQDGIVNVTENDVLANIPYAKGCGLWFDHHVSEHERLGNFSYNGMSKIAPSCARVIWEFYGGKEKFPPNLEAMLTYVDRVDSGNLTSDDILTPAGWVLLGFIMDPRTGLGRYKDYRISNYQLMENLVDYCGAMPVEEILALPDVQERIARYHEQDGEFRKMLKKYAVVYKNVLLLDLRPQEEIYSGNRFTIYSLYPECNVSVQVIWGLRKQNVVITVGHSILNRTSNANVGSLMLKYGGGGHQRVGTCQVPIEQAQKALQEIITALQDK